MLPTRPGWCSIVISDLARVYAKKNIPSDPKCVQLIVIDFI